MSLHGARCLVTGGAGFLGSHLCRRLLEAGAEVHATSREPRAAGAGASRWWQVDLSAEEPARRLVQEVRPDRLFHLAGHVSADPALGLVPSTFASLLGSTVHVLCAAAETGCGRVLLTGSLTEPDPAEGEAVPSSPYAAAKWAAGGYGRMFAQHYGVPVVTLRPFMAYGPGQHPTKLVPYVTLALLRGEAPRLSSGRWPADWIYVDDVVDGLLAAAAVPRCPASDRTLDLATGTLTESRDVVLAVWRHVGAGPEPVFGAQPDRPAEQVRRPDLESARRELGGWSARVELDEGLRRTVAWYRARVGGAAERGVAR